MTKFQVGDKVEYQGEVHQVVDIGKEWAVGGQFVTYFVKSATSGEEKIVRNGHVVLKKVA